MESERERKRDRERSSVKNGNFRDLGIYHIVYKAVCPVPC